MKQWQDLPAYEYIAFLTGFVLLSFELVASRILAPAIGSSIYVWTSIIGVIIAALAAGYNFGGKLADKRVEPMDIVWLLFGSSAAILFTILSAPFLLTAILQTPSDPRMQGMIASAILFAPASFLLGAISPYIARLKNLSVDTTGRTIASLSALNAWGSIAGTFLTGFIFFAYVGSRTALLLLIIVLLVSSWLIAPGHRYKDRVLFATAILVLSFLALLTKPAGVLAIIDTPSASYRISDIEYEGRPARTIATGPNGQQSGIYLDDSGDLVFSYTQKMAEIVDKATSKDSILILGGGTFTLPQYLAERYPETAIDVVEIDPELVSIARQYFGYSDPATVQIITRDARTFLNDNTKQYDIVLVDVYNDTFIPFSLATAEYTDHLRRAVSPSGLVVVNMIGAESGVCGELLGRLHATYSDRFKESLAFPMRDPSLEVIQNIITVYSSTELAKLFPEAQKLNVPKSPRLTDDYAPVEHLQSQCYLAA